MREVKVIHLELKKDHSHYYYGSLLALFQNHSNDIGVSYAYIRQLKLYQTHYYENDKCIIRQGILVTATKEE